MGSTVFIDSAKIVVKSGAGGRGCSSLYRDKYKRKGVPDGGDGGKGADIIFKADRNLLTLLDFQYNRHFFGKHGEHGSGKTRKGKDAIPVVVRVPCGTIIKDFRNGTILRDLNTDGEEIIVARGGAGGLGNRHKREATDGEPAEEKELFLDLKIMADIGVVGFPNAGKSTLISGISNAHPKIAAYPFTTKFPVLGVVRRDEKSFVIADVPGLIEGSAQGRGLGDRFLRHLERTKMLVHVIDMAGFEGRDPVADYKAINKELKLYSPELAKKPQIVAANKMDLEGAQGNLEKFTQVVKKKVYPISALEKKGLEEIVNAICRRI